MNAKRGLIRLFVVISATIVLLTLALSWGPIVEAIRVYGTTGIKISKDGNEQYVRVPISYASLDQHDKNLVSKRLLYRLGNLNSVIENCREFQRSIEDRLTSSDGTTDVNEALLSRLSKALVSREEINFDILVSPIESAAIKYLFPEYADLTPQTFETKVQEKLDKCQSANFSSYELKSELEEMVDASFVYKREYSDGSIFWILFWGTLIIGGLWVSLFAGFWVVSGFRTKG